MFLQSHTQVASLPSELAAIRVLVFSTDGQRRAETARLASEAGLVGPTAPADPSRSPASQMMPRRLNLLIAAMSERVDPHALAWLTRMRADADPNVALTPAIAILTPMTLDSLRLLVAGGFDDVITEPVSGGGFAARVRATIIRPHDFYRTPTYVGPDRRRLKSAGVGQDRRGTGSAFAFRLLIVRDPASGCRLVSQTPVGGGPMPAPAPSADDPPPSRERASAAVLI